MGHVTDTYNDVKALGVAKLRSFYANSNLTIRPRTTMSKMQMIREFAKVVGVDPNTVQLEPHTKYVDPQERERLEIRQLMREVRNEPLKLQTG